MDGLDWRPKDGRSGRWREERPRHSHSASVDIDETSWTARQQRWKRDAAVRAADVREAADGLLRRVFCRLDAVMPAAVADGSGQAGCDERGNVNICAASAVMPAAVVDMAARLGTGRSDNGIAGRVCWHGKIGITDKVHLLIRVCIAECAAETMFGMVATRCSVE